MKVYYDKEHDACAVEFDKDDTIFMDTADGGGIYIDSCKGGKPEIIKKQLRFKLDDEAEECEQATTVEFAADDIIK